MKLSSALRRRLFLTALAPLLLSSMVLNPLPLHADDNEAVQNAVDYERDIKPIFTRHCYSCHGPLKQRSGFRLDAAKSILKGGDSGPAVVPGKAGESLLLQVLTGDAGYRMPPEGKPLEGKEIELIKLWIERGARGPADEEVVADARQYWSFQPAKRPAVPKVRDAAWVRNPIDAFIAARQEQLKLTHRPEAPRDVLLRRVYLDLIGLPPTQEELNAFLADTSDDAYEKVVNKLLASPRHGERWGRHWMDVWRYSDWYGRRNSNEIRYSQYHIWRWRDWIIESLNEDKGYDRMVLEMLAGDEIAPGDADVLRATGFLGRNWYKFDRDVWLRETVEHTSMGFLALTMKCARCHDHKFDPILQKDYYQMRAFFEPHEVRLDPVAGNVDPLKQGVARVYDAHFKNPTYLFLRGDDRYPDKDHPLQPAVPASLGNTALKIAAVELSAEGFYPALRSEVIEATKQQAQAAIAKAKLALENAAKNRDKTRAAFAGRKNKASVESAKKPASAGKRVLFDDFSRPRPDTWQADNGQWVYENGKLAQKQVTQWAMFTTREKHPRDFRARIRFKNTGKGTYNSVGFSFDVVGTRDFQAVYTSVTSGNSSVQAFHRHNSVEAYPPAGIVRTPLRLNEVTEVEFAVRDTLLNVWVNGVMKIAYRLPMARQAGSFALWNHTGTCEFHEVSIETLPDDVPLAETPTTASASSAAKPRIAEDWQQALDLAEQAVLVAEARLQVAHADEASLLARIAAERARYISPTDSKLAKLASTAAVAERQAKVAQTTLDVLLAKSEVEKARQAKDSKALGVAEKKLAAADKQFAAAKKAAEAKSDNYMPLGTIYPKTSTGRRLALAKWIADANNPRTARVAVNHIWQRHFGEALVATVANFGLAGKRPTHPELLDWLATELTANDWSMKHIHRLIVTSSTYRMTSSAGGSDSPNLKIDPANKYLWRMNYKRMEAEAVRDSLLHLAGQLDATMGGPELSQDLGQTSKRRSVYFRLTPDDKMEFLELFDLANPNECYERKKSVVPQQSLALLNSAIALDKSRLIARALSKDKASHAAFVQVAFAHVLGRVPTDAEAKRCEAFLKEQSSLLARPGKLATYSGSASATIAPATDPIRRARENLVHVLVNHNDFVTIR